MLSAQPPVAVVTRFVELYATSVEATLDHVFGLNNLAVQAATEVLRGWHALARQQTAGAAHRLER
jgi:hypothetical protein